jgi:hypothetical protein
LLQSDAPRHDLPRQPEGEGAVLLFAFGDDLEQQFETGTESCRLYTSKTSTRRKRASRPAGTPLRMLGQIRDGRWARSLDETQEARDVLSCRYATSPASSQTGYSTAKVAAQQSY